MVLKPHRACVCIAATAAVPRHFHRHGFHMFDARPNTVPDNLQQASCLHAAMTWLLHGCRFTLPTHPLPCLPNALYFTVGWILPLPWRATLRVPPSVTPRGARWC